MSLVDTIKPVLTPINKEGYPFITLFLIATLVGWLLVGDSLLVIGLLLTAWCVYFFRDPARVTPIKEGLVVSPADGVVQMIRKADPPPELEYAGKQMLRISVFMNVFDVHVNRIPIDGQVTKLHYRPGAFLNASLDKASEDNERQSILMDTPDGKQIAFVQIAGLVARRILCDLEPGQDVHTGERFGMIRFGSRVDVYVPERTPVLVCEGQRCVAGETILADLGKRPKDSLQGTTR